MRSFAPLALLLALGACAAADQPASDVLPGERSASAAAREVVNGVGTPVHAVMKGVELRRHDGDRRSRSPA